MKADNSSSNGKKHPFEDVGIDYSQYKDLEGDDNDNYEEIGEEFDFDIGEETFEETEEENDLFEIGEEFHFEISEDDFSEEED